jgi:hypothetical protein
MQRPPLTLLAALQQLIAAVRMPNEAQNAVLESFRVPFRAGSPQERTLLLVLLLAGEYPGQAPFYVLCQSLLQVLKFCRVFRGHQRKFAATGSRTGLQGGLKDGLIQ